MPALKILLLGSVSPDMARPQPADGEVLQIWRLVTNVLDKQSRIADVGLSCSFGDGRGANTPHHQNLTGYEPFFKSLDLE
jgi:hypothetical protein